MNIIYCLKKPTSLVLAFVLCIVTQTATAEEASRLGGDPVAIADATAIDDKNADKSGQGRRKPGLTP